MEELDNIEDSIDYDSVCTVRLNPSKVINNADVLVELTHKQLEELSPNNAFWNGSEVVTID